MRGRRSAGTEQEAAQDTHFGLEVREAVSADAITVAPHIYRVVLENDRVRVLEARGKPGDKTEMHSHPPQVTIGVKDSNFRLTSPDGQSVDVELKAGQVIYLDAVEHFAEVTGDSESQILLVELK
jgi:quercetin dioxygenase-like cupin family protein